MSNKYLFLIPRLGGGGAERVLVTIANQLCKNNEIKILTITAAGSFYKLNETIEVRCIESPVNRKNKITLYFTEMTGALKSLYRIKREVDDWQPDAMLSFLTDTNFLAIILKMFGQIKCRLVVSERADPDRRGKMKKWFEKKLYPKADVIVCQSKPVADFFSKKHVDKIKVIQNPINRDAIPEVYSKERKKRIVGVGRLDYQKNFALLINAFAQLGEQFSDYQLEIYGNGSLEKELQNQIDSLRLTNRVHLMGMKKDVMHYIADASLFVLSSDFEGFPNALIEAMATGLPVISTDFTPTGVAAEIVTRNNGLIVPAGDVKSLAEAMREVLSDASLMEMYSKNNRKMLNKFDEHRIAMEWEATLMGTLNGGGYIAP